MGTNTLDPPGFVQPVKCKNYTGIHQKKGDGNDTKNKNKQNRWAWKPNIQRKKWE